MEYRDFRYILQDTGTLYVGAKFNLKDLASEEEVPFKFRSIVMRYVFGEMAQEDTLESIFYYMAPEGLMYEVFLQLRTKVKVAQLKEVKRPFGKRERVYREQVYTLKDFAGMDVEKKKQAGMVVQEIQISKLALMAFSA